MLLDKVEAVLTSKLNAIVKETEKECLCVLPYEVEIGDVYLSKLSYLTTDTLVYVDGEPYTTFSGYRPHSGGKGFISYNEFSVECGKSGVVIGYVNDNNYLHLPDFLTAQLLYVFKGGVKAVMDDIVLLFTPENVKVFKMKTYVPHSYYVYVLSFNYNENADLLARIIGLTDVYKRGQMKDFCYYFIYPYVSLVLYKRLKSTLYPPNINSLVKNVCQTLKTEIEDELKSIGFSTNPIELRKKIESLISTFNKTSKVIVE